MSKIINKIVKVLIISDFFLYLGWGLLTPVFAIFILENIATQNILEATKVAGFAALAYWITKSLLEIPIGHFLDKKHGEKDDFWLMVAGTFITALVPIGFLFSSMPWHIYFFQIMQGIGMAMTLPAWLAIFTRHIDKGKEAFEWGMATTSIGTGAGIAGGIGGIVAGVFGFNVLFIFVSIFTLLSAILLLFIRNNVFTRDKDGFVIPMKSIVEP
ncbi:MAG: MFS transporter [Candidatus Staskawiczbacteria bacterium]|nr:MFS transporter [Candidatus Staskawiczbacteria bacterium]